MGKEEMKSVKAVRGDSLIPALFGGYDEKLDLLSDQVRAGVQSLSSLLESSQSELAMTKAEIGDWQQKMSDSLVSQLMLLKRSVEDLSGLRNFERENPVLLECIQSLLGVPRDRTEYERSPKLFDRLFNLLEDLEDSLERTGLVADRSIANVSRDFVQIQNDGVETPSVVKPAVKRGVLTVLKGTLIVPKGYEPEQSSCVAQNVLKKIDLSEVGE